jgi:hypothetical protein
MQGWIMLHRCLMQKPIWLESTSEQKVVLITLLMMANHQGKEWEWKGEKYKADPGQFVTSLESITQKCGKGVSIQNVRTALKRFEKYDFLTSESTNKNRLITIVNWGLYQETKDETNKQTNKQLTSNQQATNKQLTTNNNDNNDNNEKKVIKKIKYADFVSMLETEYQKLVEQFGEIGTTDRIEKLNLYKGSTGKKYKNDYLTILSWERNNKKGGGKSGSNEDSRKFAEEYGIQF